MEYYVRGVCEVGRLFELAPRRLVQNLSGALFRFGELVPRFQNFRVYTERGDARTDEILLSGLCHHCELTRHNRHYGLQRHYIRVITYSGARRVLRVIHYFSAEVVCQYVQEGLFAAWEKILSDTAAHVIVIVVGNLFLILFPTASFHRFR